MFWKKKKTAIETPHLPSDDKRQSYRYTLNDRNRFSLDFKGIRVDIINISAGGLAFRNNGFDQFDFDFINFELDIPNFNGDCKFCAGLRILKIDESDICHCIFEQCSLEQHELIHKYVLEMQKNDLAH